MLITLLVCLGILEIGLRYSNRYAMDLEGGFLTEGGLSYKLKKNAAKTVYWPGRSYSVFTCDSGFRAPKPGVRDLGHAPYFAMVGSSEVFGNGLNYEQTFVGVFAEKMRSHGVDVVNMAVPGHHFMEQAELFKQFAATAKHPPSEVLIFLNPLVIGGYDDNHTNTVIRLGETFEKTNLRAALIRRFLANSSAVYCFFRDSIRLTQQRLVGRKDFALAFYLERYSRSHPIRTPEKSADFLKHLRDLEAAVRAIKAKPVVVYAPPVGGFLLDELQAQGKLDGASFDTRFFPSLLRDHCEREGVQFVDLEPMLQERYNRKEKLNFDGDAHFNEPTSKLIGERLHDIFGSSGAHTAN